MNELSVKARFTACLCLALSLLILPGCSSRQRAGVIPLGVIAYTKGQQAEMSGQPTLNAVQMAVDEINVKGIEINGQPYRFELYIEGIEDTPEEAVSAMQRLINQKNVVAVIGPQYSSEAIPASEVAEAAQVVMISPTSTNPRTTLDKEFVFRMSFSDDFQGELMAGFAYTDLNIRRVAILFDISDNYSRGLAVVFQTEFEKIGGQVVASESYTGRQEDFRDAIARIKASNPEALYLPNYQEDVINQVAQLQDAHLRLTLLGSDGWDQRTMPSLPGFDGAYMTAHWSRQLTDVNTVSFVDKYQAQYNQEPNDTAALTYDAVYLLAEAVSYAKSADPVAIRDGLYDLQPFSGVSGIIDFTTTGNPLKSVVILKFVGGHDEFYKLLVP